MATNSGEDKPTQATVLVVENTPGPGSLATLLTDRYPVLTANSADQALAVIANQDHPGHIGVVIAHHHLVDMTGMQLFERLDEALPEALRVLINDSEDVNLLLRAINTAHIYHYLHKPFSEDEFLAVVAAALSTFESHHHRAACVEELEEQLQAKDEELAEAYQMVEEASLTDSLTGLRNRAYMQHAFETELSLIQRKYHDSPEGENDLLFLLADVDQFKPVNDIYGHAAGDRLLEEFACRLQEVFRGSDIVVRWGGEEFLIVARFARRDGGDAIAERFRRAIAGEPFDLGKGVKLDKTCSIGFAAFPFFTHAPDVIPWNRVVNFADLARQVAKKSGRNCWVGFEPKPGVEPLDAAKRIITSPQQAFEAGVITIATSAGSPSLLSWS